MKNDIKTWEQKYNNLASQYETATQQLHDKTEKLKNKDTRNLNKKLKRRDLRIETQAQEIKDTNKENESLTETVENLKKDKKSLLQKVCKLKKQRNIIVEQNLNKIDMLKHEITQKDKDIKQLEELNETLEMPVIETFCDGKYTNEIRQTIMTLVMEHGVSQKKVNGVISTVLKNLTGQTLLRLPSTGVKSRLMIEAKRVANQQLMQELLKNDTTFTLHQDGTSKHHRHFQSYQVSTSEGKTLSLGMIEIGRGTAEHIFQSFKELLNELSDSVKNQNKRKYISKIVNAIIATMSDQCATNNVFNKKLQDFKAELIPLIYDNWEHLESKEQKDLSKICNFFCKMHILVNFASESEKCLQQLEQSLIAEGYNPFSFNKGECGITRLVRTASKAFAEKGCEKSGVGGHFDTYLQDNCKKNFIISFRGHRFNHMYYAAGAIYHHRDDIRNFVDLWGEQNDLIKSVSFDIRESLYLGGIRALGLLDKVVTGPLWRVIESSPNALSLNKHLHQVQLCLEAWSKNASSLLEGECLFSESVASITKDEIYQSLIAPVDPMLETYTQMALEFCCGAMLLILDRQAKDQLPGGHLYHVDDTTKENLQNVPTTNTVSERDFAQLDHLMRIKPSANVVTYESIVLWTNNKTTEWLRSLPSDKYQSLLDEARLNAPYMKDKLKEKQKELYSSKLQNLKEKQTKKAAQQEKQNSNKVKLTLQLNESGGLWTEKKDITKFKVNATSSKYRDALITQLQFRKQVLGSSCPKHLFFQSKQGKQLSIQEMEENLERVLEISNEQSDCNDKKLVYKDTDERQASVNQTKQNLNKRIFENRQKVLISQQKEMLPKLLLNPDLIVHKSIKHKCKDPETGDIEWCKGQVLGIFKENTNPLKNEYWVRYEVDEEDSQWYFPLLQDLKNGDLLIV